MLLIALCLLTTGCATWNAQGPTPDAAIRRSDPDLVRVVCKSGSVLELSLPRVDGDSLRGVAKDGPCAIALEDVDHVEVRGIKTSVRIVVVALALLLGFVVIGVGAMSMQWN